jgi:predicted phage tail protein
MLEKLSFILEPVELESSDEELEAESSDEELEAESSDEEPSADELEDESSDYELSTDELAERWAARDPQAIEEVNEQLASKGLTIEDVTARALSAEIENFERIDRMVMNAEARRNAALRELERHRMTLAQALRQASDDVVDADFEDVAPVRRRLRDKA